MISNKLSDPLAVGRTAELFAWGDDFVLKLFFDWVDPDSIQHEQTIARAVQSCGLRVPAVGNILQVNHRIGIIYERVNGKNMWDILQKQPWRIFSLANQTAQIQSDMHSTLIRPELPSLHHRVKNKLLHASKLPDLQKNALLEVLDTMPDGNSICHGDFHPGNIIITRESPVVIDWIDASYGNPLADIARSTIILLGAVSSSQIPDFPMKTLIRIFHRLYLRQYFRLRPGGVEEYRLWLPIVAAARLSENIPELESWLHIKAEMT